MSRTFATDPGNVATDRSGNVLPGRLLTVLTAPNGTPITDLVDLDGNTLQALLTDQNGRYPFKILADTWDVVTLQAPDGGLWDVAAVETMRGLASALPTAQAAKLAADTALASANAIAYSVKAFGAKGDGSTNDRAAFQACMDALAAAGGGRMIIPAGGTYVINGVVQLRDDITISGEGAVLTKTQQSPYVMFVSLSEGQTGYGSGVRNVTFEGVRFVGNFATEIGICAASLHHAQNVTFERCIFEQCQRAGHTIDLGGCESISFRQCRFIGWQTSKTGSTWYTVETIQLDASVTGSLSYPDAAGSHDGLFTRGVVLEDCEFLPLTIGATTYPAPNVIGAHAVWEGKFYDDITLRNIDVVDPVNDDVSTAATTHQGLIHLPTCRRVRIDNLRVRASSPRTLRIVDINAATQGRTAASDPNVSPSTTGTWPTPNVCSDIKLTNISIDGFTAAGATNPKTAVRIVGAATGKNRDITIGFASIHNAYRPLEVAQADNVRLVGNSDDGALQPVLIDASVTRLINTGNTWS